MAKAKEEVSKAKSHAKTSKEDDKAKAKATAKATARIATLEKDNERLLAEVKAKRKDVDRQRDRAEVVEREVKELQQRIKELEAEKMRVPGKGARKTARDWDHEESLGYEGDDIEVMSSQKKKSKPSTQTSQAPTQSSIEETIQQHINAALQRLLPPALLAQPQVHHPPEPNLSSLSAYLPSTLHGSGLALRYGAETPMPQSSSLQPAAVSSSFMGSQAHSFSHAPAQSYAMAPAPAPITSQAPAPAPAQTTPQAPAHAPGPTTPQAPAPASNSGWHNQGFASSFGQSTDPLSAPQSSMPVRHAAPLASPREATPPDFGKAEIPGPPEAPPAEMLMAFWQFMNSKKA